MGVGWCDVDTLQVSKTIEAGIFFERNVRHLTIRNVVASDNYVGMVILPTGQGLDATVTVRDSLFVGDSAYGGCGGKAYAGTCRGGAWSGCRSSTGKARIGLMAAIWMEGPKQFPRSSKTFPYHNAMFTDASFHAAGVTVRDVVFANWTLVDGCYDSRHAISTNPMGPSQVRERSSPLGDFHACLLVLMSDRTVSHRAVSTPGALSTATLKPSSVAEGPLHAGL